MLSPHTTPEGTPERPNTIERLQRDLAKVAQVDAENVQPNAGAGVSPSSPGRWASARRSLALHGTAAREPCAASAAAPLARVETIGAYDISSPGFGLSTGDFMSGVKARMQAALCDAPPSTPAASSSNRPTACICTRFCGLGGTQQSPQEGGLASRPASARLIQAQMLLAAAQKEAATQAAAATRFQDKYKRAKAELILARKECSRLSKQQNEKESSEQNGQDSLSPSSSAAAAQQQVLAFEEQLSAYDRSLKQMRDENSAFRQEREKQAAALQGWESKVKLHEQKHADLESELASARYTLAGLEKRAEALEGWELQARMHEASSQDLQARLGHALENLAGTEVALSKRDEELRRWQQRANEEQQEKADIQHKLSATLERLRGKEAELLELNARMQDLCERQHTAIQAHDEELEKKLESALAAKTEELVAKRNLEDELSARTEELAAKTKELLECAGLYREQEQRTVDRNREVAELRGRLEATLEKLAEKEAELLAATARSQHVVREAALSWSPAMSRTCRSPGSLSLCSDLSTNASPTRAEAPAGVCGLESVANTTIRGIAAPPQADERLNATPWQVVEARPVDQSMEEANNVTFELEAVIRQSNEDLKETQEQLTASQGQVASLTQELASSKEQLQTSICKLSLLRQEHEHLAQMLQEARQQKDEAEAAQHAAQEAVRKKDQLWKELAVLEIRLENEAMEKERERGKVSQLIDQMKGIRSVVAEVGTTFYEDLAACAAQREFARSELQALRLLTDEAQRSHGEVVSSLHLITMHQQQNHEAKEAHGVTALLGTEHANEKKQSTALLMQTAALELDRREKENVHILHIQQLQAAAHNAQTQLLVMREALVSQSKEMEREKRLLANAHVTLQRQQDAAEARIESTITARVHAAVKEAEARMAENAHSLRTRVEEAESKLAPLHICLAKCAREARRHALEEIGELKAELCAKQGEVEALKDQVKELCATQMKTFSSSAKTSANETERLLRVENSSLVQQVKALVAVIADLKTEKAHQQAHIDVLLCEAAALKMQTEQMSIEMKNLSKCLESELEQSATLLKVHAEQCKAAQDCTAHLQDERLQMVDQVNAHNADAIFWRQKSVELDETYRASISRLERRCKKLSSVAALQSTSLAGFHQQLMHTRTTIEHLHAEIGDCHELLALERRNFENIFLPLRWHGLRESEWLKREIEKLKGEHAHSEHHAVVALHEAAAELETLRHHRRSSQATVEELRGQLRGMEEKLNNAAVVAARSQQQRDELIDVLQCYMSFVQSLCATSQESIKHQLMMLEELSDDIPPRPLRLLRDTLSAMSKARISDEQLRQHAIGAILQVDTGAPRLAALHTSSVRGEGAGTSSRNHCTATINASQNPIIAGAGAEAGMISLVGAGVGSDGHISSMYRAPAPGTLRSGDASRR